MILTLATYPSTNELGIVSKRFGQITSGTKTAWEYEASREYFAIAQNIAPAIIKVLILNMRENGLSFSEMNVVKYLEDGRIFDYGVYIKTESDAVLLAMILSEINHDFLWIAKENIKITSFKDYFAKGVE